VLYAVETRDRGGPENSYLEVPFVVGASVKD